MKPNRISLSLKTTKTQLPSLRPGDIKQKGKTHAARAKTSSSDLTFEDMENIRKQVILYSHILNNPHSVA